MIVFKLRLKKIMDERKSVYELDLLEVKKKCFLLKIFFKKIFL